MGQDYYITKEKEINFMRSDNTDLNLQVKARYKLNII